jgi:hypothetical protein
VERHRGGGGPGPGARALRRSVHRARARLGGGPDVVPPQHGAAGATDVSRFHRGDHRDRGADGGYDRRHTRQGAGSGLLGLEPGRGPYRPGALRGFAFCRPLSYNTTEAMATPPHPAVRRRTKAHLDQASMRSRRPEKARLRTRSRGERRGARNIVVMVTTRAT